jgi:hypothetical protein
VADWKPSFDSMGEKCQGYKGETILKRERKNSGHHKRTGWLKSKEKMIHDGEK